MGISKKKGAVFFYCNANPKIGTGHFWRSFRIANELKRTGTKVYFLFEHISDKLTDVLEGKGIEFKRVFSSTPKVLISAIKAFQEGRTMLVIDSDDTKFYSKEFQNDIKGSGIKLMLITINPNFYYLPDIILNQNIMSLSQNFEVSKKTRKLFGPKYLVFDKQFYQAAQEIIKEGHGLMLAFGGADPMGYTLKILQHLLKTEISSLFELHVIIGRLNKEAEKIKELCGRSSGVTVYQDTREIKNIMVKCSLVICSPGMIFWEASLMGLRAILLSSSKREKPVAEFLGNHNYAYTVGHFDQNIKSNVLRSIEGEIINPDDERYANLASLRKSINPKGIHLIAKEINNTLIS